MPYYTGGPIGPNPDQVTLDDFKSSGLLSFKTAVEDAWDSNPTNLAIDWLKFQGANRGDRLDKATSEQAVKQAGVKLAVPDSGYTAAALDILINRKQDETRRADIMARAPTGIVPTSTRFAAQLLTGLTDPLNIAAAFIPVVGEARYASMLANAGDGILARSAVRAGVGAAEGAVGVAALEPFAYGAHQQLQDDYKMTDSLMNVAFGAALGGTLHVGAGAIGDVLRGGAHPATRFQDLSVNDVQTVMNFERQRAELPAADHARALESFSPEMRRAIDANIPTEAPPVHTAADAPPLERSPISAAALHDSMSPEIKAAAMRSAVADMLQGRMPNVEHIVGMDPVAVGAGKAAATIDDVRATAERQARPESVSIADFFSSKAADQRLTDAPKSEPMVAAEADLAKAGERLESVRKNLEQSGMAPEKLQAALDEMKPFDEARNDAKALGDAARAAALCGVRA